MFFAYLCLNIVSHTLLWSHRKTVSPFKYVQGVNMMDKISHVDDE